MDPQWLLLMTFYQRGTLFVARRQSPSRFMSWVREHRIKFCLLPYLVIKQPPKSADETNARADPLQHLRHAQGRPRGDRGALRPHRARSLRHDGSRHRACSCRSRRPTWSARARAASPDRFARRASSTRTASRSWHGRDRRAAAARPRRCCRATTRIRRRPQKRFAGELVPHRRPLPPGRARLLLHRRPAEGHDPARRREHRGARGRGGADGAARGHGSGVRRRCRTTTRGEEVKAYVVLQPRIHAATACRRERIIEHCEAQPRALQGAALHRVQHRAAEDAVRQDRQESADQGVADLRAGSYDRVEDKMAMSSASFTDFIDYGSTPPGAREDGAAPRQLPARLPRERGRVGQREARPPIRWPRISHMYETHGATHVVVKARDLETTFDFRIANEDVAAFCRDTRAALHRLCRRRSEQGRDGGARARVRGAASSGCAASTCSASSTSCASTTRRCTRSTPSASSSTFRSTSTAASNFSAATVDGLRPAVVPRRRDGALSRASRLRCAAGLPVGATSSSRSPGATPTSTSALSPFATSISPCRIPAMRCCCSTATRVLQDQMIYGIGVSR